MYFLSYTMLHNPQTNTKYFKNCLKFKKNLFLHYFRPERSTSRSIVAITGQNGRLVARHRAFVQGRARLCTFVGRPSTVAVDRPTDWMYLTLCLGRSTDNSKFFLL